MSKLIVTEGLDSSGKETQSRLLTDNLNAMGIKAKRIEFPNYSSPSSSLVKMYLAGEFGTAPDDVNAYAASTFYAADRYASYKKDFGDFYLNGDGVIVADRYTTSNIIHQAGKIKDAAEKDKFLTWLYDYEYNLLGLPKPDLVVFLDMPPQISIKLMAQRENKAGTSEKDIHERNRQYLFDAYDNAIEMAQRFSWQKVSCVTGENIRSINDIQQDILHLACAIIKKED